MKTARAVGPQFLRLTPQLEEDPPPRQAGCPFYRGCLGAAAAANLALDCSRCPEEGHPPAAVAGRGTAACA